MADFWGHVLILLAFPAQQHGQPGPMVRTLGDIMKILGEAVGESPAEDLNNWYTVGDWLING